MPLVPLTGKSLRLTRLSRYSDDNFLFVPLDHSVSDGPIIGANRFNRLVDDIAGGGADAVVVHKGRARMIDPLLLANCALVIHLSASTTHARDTNAKVLVGSVEEALLRGADAVSVHVNIGSDTEAAQLADLGVVAADCERWGVPLLAMVYPRGPRLLDPGNPALLAHVINIAADLGADIVKTVIASPVERMADVIGMSPIPVIVAGGERNQESLTEFTSAAMASGCRGVAIGRRVFASPDPRATVRALTSIVHPQHRVFQGSAPREMAGVS
jgi:2-amino-4,5-dihydroxy-6-oxo-7-(phosphooxy)heptanoate synthase